MEKQSEIITIKMQMILNKRLYETKQIPQKAYAAANDILTARLTKAKEYAIVSPYKMQQSG